ncbi:MAG: NADH-quinone oxidoreductase subunit NuoN [Actinobacteria bacterium]|nr:NADH-quinone oxidoreductase subunit NuoN [Actinomycetota bacterium]
MLPTPKLDFLPVLPELILAGAGIVTLLYEALAPRASRATHLGLSLVGLAAAAGASIALWDRTGDPTVLAGAIQADRLAVVARVIIISVAAVGLLLGTHYYDRSGDERRGEFYPLVLFATTGMTLIVAAADLIVVFLALEILSLSLYVLTGMSRRGQATEASMKYFLLGAFASAFFLYGVAMAYGATGTTKIAGIAHALAGQTGGQALALVALGFLAIGFGFKVSAVPFHMWTPDVYQGAPTPVTAFMAAATKVAAFGALIRVLDVSFQPLAWDWMPVIWALAAASVVVGSVLAIAQSDVKRMLAYSSIAHAGFVLTGLTAANQDGIRAALFYLIAYAMMTLGSFGVVMLVSVRGEERTSLASYSGLGRRQPLLAGLMALFMLSLAGIPPTAGFIAKVGVFGAAIRAGHWQLALVGVVSSVAAAFFYLRVVVLMYMQEPQGEEQEEDRSPLPRLALAVPAILTLVLGVFPQMLLGVLDKASVLRW